MRGLTKSNEKGFLLLTVIVTVMVLAVVIITITGLNVSRVKTAQSVSDQIRSEEMAKGVFMRYYQASFMDSDYDPTSDQAELGTKDFLVEDFSDSIDPTESFYNEIVVKVGIGS